MKHLFIVFFLTCLSVSSDAATMDTTDIRKKAEAKIEFITYKYQSGEYEEARDHSLNLIRWLEKRAPEFRIERVKAKVLEALSWYTSYRFDKASEAIKQATAFSEKAILKEDKVRSDLLLADYYLETGDYFSASNTLKHAESFLNAIHSKKLLADLEFSQAATSLKLGLLQHALTLIQKQEDYRLRMASQPEVSEEDREAVDKKPDFRLRKESYGRLMNLKSSCLVAMGLFTDADKLVANNQSWISDNIGRHHPLYRETFELQAYMAWNKKDYSNASYYYTKAYLTTHFPEYEKHKIRNLSGAVIASFYAGQSVKYRNYIRRLGMYAFRHVGASDPFQIAFEYSESYKSFIEGDFTAASNRLSRLSNHFDFIPDSDVWNIDILELNAAIHLKSGDLRKYKENIIQLAAIRRKYQGEQSPAYHKAQLEVAIYEINYGKDFRTAEKIMRNSYDAVIKKEIARESITNLMYVNAYATLFARKDMFDSAAVRSREATEIASHIYKEKSPEYGIELAEWTEYQILSGKYKEGFENLQKLDLLVGDFKSSNPELLQKIYMIMARVYNARGDFDKSGSLLNKAYRLTYEGYEKQALAEAETAEQQASLYLLTENYYKAERALMRSLIVKEEKLEPGSPLLIHPYQELARLNLTSGNYNLCEQYLKKAMTISEEVFGKGSIVYAECLLIYSDYYLSIGDVKKAEASVLMADQIEVQKLGDKNLRRAEVLLKLAHIKSKSESVNVKEVDDLYEKSAQLVKTSLGTDNPLYMFLIVKQAEFYINTGKTDKADKLLTEAQKFWSSKLGSENRYAADIELLRGNIAYSRSQYDQAEKNYLKSRSLYNSIFNEDHPSYIQASGKLARVYYMQKRADKAVDIMEEIIPKYNIYITKYFPSLSFREKSKFWNNIREEFEFYNFMALSVQSVKNPKLSGTVYNNIISTKALLLSSNIKVRESILSSKDSILVSLFNQWISQKEYLTTIISLSKQELVEQNIDVKYIEGQIERLEKEISNRSELFNEQSGKRDLVWKDVRNALKDNEYAAEIIRYRYFDKKFTDSVVYAALIVHNKSEDHPDLVIFNYGKSLEKKFFKTYRNSASLKVKDKTSYAAYWEPVKKRIPDGATVYLSMDGVFNQVNVEMMQNAEGQYAIDKNQIVYVTNTKDIIASQASIAVASGKKKEAGKDKPKDNVSEYILCGNPSFYTGEVAVRDQSIVSLAGAEKEINDINGLLASAGKPSIRLINSQVSEDTLRRIRNPKVLHIATHGFFKESTVTNEDDITSNPLLNSGLLLTGGGDILDHPENNYVNSRSGILTAYEAMNLSFDKTELVVLSACETGRGEVQAGEGVYGLQRSFLIAGSGAVIMSLFKVNDEVTKKLMLLFYQKWLASGDKRKAFIEAKREIKTQYDSPIYWGAFIMIEGKSAASNNGRLN